MNSIRKEFGSLSNFSSHPYRGTDETTARFASTGARLEGSRVLVVEDEFIIAMEIQTNLEDAGAVVIGPAYTVASALALLDRESISAAILDLRLGRDTAIPVASALALRHIPFFFYTGQPPNDPVRRAWPQTTTVSKPASGDEIVQTVSGLLRTTH